MSDEHVKLVAKIQHFYDVMVQRLNEMQGDCVSSCNDIERTSYREKSIELLQLIGEFGKTFESFIYKVNDEK